MSHPGHGSCQISSSRNFRAQIQGFGPHVAVRQLEPRPCKGIGKFARDRHGTVARSFRRLGPSASPCQRWSSSTARVVSRQPVAHDRSAESLWRASCCAPAGAFRQFPLIAEQHVEIAHVPLCRVGVQAPFNADVIVSTPLPDLCLFPAKTLRREPSPSGSTPTSSDRPRRVLCRTCDRPRPAPQFLRRSSPCARKFRGCHAADACASGLPSGPSGLT